MSEKTFNEKHYVIFVIVLAALFTLGAAIYSYTGPNRTVTIQDNSACVWEKSTCQWNNRHDEYRWHVTNSVSCSSESKPWLTGDNYHGPCTSSNAGRSHWNKHDNSTTETVTYPPATVGAGAVCASPGLNGWCAGGGALNITGSEPLAGQQIIAIEGTRNAVSIACVAASCSVPLLEGANNFTYWAVSSFGDTSLMGASDGLKQDSLAPQISGPTLTGSLSPSGWYASAVTFNTTANDAVSGLASLTCTLDGSPVACTGVTVSGQGAHTLLAQAGDAAGNSSQKTANFSIDTLPPTLDVQLSGTSGSNNWYKAAQVSATTVDPSPGSGLAALEYSLDGGAWNPFPATGSFDIPDGKHTLDVRSFDNAGNIKQAAQIVAWVDSVAPDITLNAVVGTSGKNNWYVSPTLVGAEADNGTSGLETFEYRLDNGAWTNCNPCGLTLSDGVHSIVYYARDTAGWVTQVVQNIKVDTQAPRISGSLAGTPGANNWFISNATLTAAANDSTSGIAIFTYTKDGGPATAYTAPLTLTDGIHTVLLYAEDQAGLTDTFSPGIKVDTLAPALDVLTVLPEWVQDTVTLNGTAGDGGSGLLKIEISTDNGATWHTAVGASSWNYAWNTTPGSDGLHILHVRALDAAGLDTESVFNAQVDNGAPVIELPASWYIWETVELNAYDTVSGLTQVRLEISDPGDRWPPRRLTFAAGHLPVDLLWDRRFGDGTLAPSGDYDLRATAYDRLGNQRHKSATIHIPWVSDLLLPPATATPLSTPRATATATATSLYPTPTRTPTPTVGAALLFGTPGSGEDATPTPTGEPLLRPTPTAESFSSWLASVFLPPAANESTTDAGQGSDPQPSPAAGDPNLLFDAAAIAAVAGVTTYWAQKKKEEEEARQAAEAARRAEEAAADEAASRRRRTARARKMNPLEAAAQKLKEAIAAVTQKEQKEWKAERYQQVSQTDEYKNSENKNQFMKQELENIKQQEAAYREKKKAEEEAARLPAPPPPPPLPPMPEGLSPEAQAAWLHSPAAAQWAAANTAALQNQYAASVMQAQTNSDLSLSSEIGLGRRIVNFIKGIPGMAAGAEVTLSAGRKLLLPDLVPNPDLTFHDMEWPPLMRDVRNPYIAMTDSEFELRVSQLPAQNRWLNWTTAADGVDGLGRFAPPAVGGLSLGMSLTGTFTGNRDLKATGDTLGSTVGIQQGLQTFGKVDVAAKAVSTQFGTVMTGASGILGGLTYVSSVVSLATDPALDPAKGYDARVERVGTMFSGVGGALLFAAGACAIFGGPPGIAAAAVLAPAGLVLMGAGGAMQNAEWIRSTTSSIIQNTGSAVQGLFSTPPTAPQVHPAQPNPTPPNVAPTATATSLPHAVVPASASSTPQAALVETPLTPSAAGTPEP